jgi:hypothetical protein
MRWLNPRLSGRFRSEGKPGELVLVLTTIGRKTGEAHKTPLQYELVEGVFYVASARGQKALVSQHPFKSRGDCRDRR